MTQTYIQFKTSCATKIQDAASTNFTSGEWDTFILDATKEAGQYVPHIVKVSFSIESRTGTATSTSAGNLVDATESQFLAGDVGKEVYNTTAKSWAVITGYTSATTLALSKDIMTSGDNYSIFNAGCSSNKEVSISNIDDYLNIDSVEYPVGTKRNWVIDGTVLTIKVDSIPDSKVATTATQPNTEVVVRFRKRHLISQLTDLSGVIAASASAAATAISMSALQAAGTIETGQEFTIANIRGTYTITSDATIGANTVAVTIYPGLESAISGTGSVVTIKGSTLTPTLEPPVQDLAAALAGVSKPMSLYQHAFTANSAIALASTAIALVAARINAATADAGSARTALSAATVQIAAMTTYITAATARVTLGIAYAATAGTSSIPSATTEIAKIVAEVQLAASALAAGTSLINTIPLGGGAGEYMGQASGDLGVAQGRMANGQTWLQKAAAELTVANSYFNAAGLDIREGSEIGQQANIYHANAAQYLNTAATELRVASENISQGNINLQKAGVELRIVDSGRTMESYARNNLEMARAKLRGFSGYPHSTRYTQD